MARKLLRLPRMRSKEKPKADLSYLDTIDDKEILRVVKEIRRRNGLPENCVELSGPSTESSSMATEHQGSGVSDSGDEDQQQQPKQKKQSRLKSILVKKTNPEESDRAGVTTENLDRPSRVSSILNRIDTPMFSVNKKPPPAVNSSLDKFSIKKKAPPAVNTFLDFSYGSYDSPSWYVSGDFTYSQTQSTIASPRTPQAAQFFSFVCTPMFTCEKEVETDERIFKDVFSSAESETETAATPSDLGTPTVPRRPSLFKSVYDQVLDDLETGMSEDLRQEDDSLYPSTVVPPPKTILSSRTQKSREQLVKQVASIMSEIDNDSRNNDDTAFLSLSGSMLSSSGTQQSEISADQRRSASNAVRRG